MSGIAELSARFGRLAEQGDALAARAGAVDISTRLDGVLGDHVRTGNTLSESVVSAEGNTITISGPRGLRWSPGAEAEIHKPVGAVALAGALEAFR